MNIRELEQTWSIPGPWLLRSMEQGDNNLTNIVETPSRKYVLRRYQSDRALERIRFELLVLSRLQQKRLAFRIPAPIPTVTGDLCAVVAGSIFTLTPWLPGSPPQNEDLEQTHSAGDALAELQQALADLPVEITSQVAPYPPSIDFESWANISIKPTEIIETLALTEEEQKQILTILDETQTSAPELYRSLPQQIIHRDYDSSNILMQGNSVSAVLDFEFCGYDLRALDLSYALSKWPGDVWNTGHEWEILDSFATGYLQHQMLIPEELDALPLIFRLRTTCSLFFRFGRFVRGLEPQANLLEHIQEALNQEAWRRTNAEKLLRHIHSWRR